MDAVEITSVATDVASATERILVACSSTCPKVNSKGNSSAAYCRILLNITDNKGRATTERSDTLAQKKSLMKIQRYIYFNRSITATTFAHLEDYDESPSLLRLVLFVLTRNE